MRKLVFGLLALAIVLIGTGESAAQKKKKAANAPVTGKVFAVDTEKGFIRLIVTSRNKKETSTTDPSFKIDDDTKIIIQGKDKKELMGVEGLKEIKKDDMATVVMDTDFKTISVTVTPGGGGKK